MAKKITAEEIFEIWVENIEGRQYFKTRDLDISHVHCDPVDITKALEGMPDGKYEVTVSIKSLAD